MNINKSKVKYSSIVEIGEMVSELEKSTGEIYLKLHRGVMDIETIELNSIVKSIDFNQKKIQQYSGNDGDVEFIKTIKETFCIPDHHLIVTPGGMASIDIIINSISDKLFWIPKYHWGSWNKILTTHNKHIQTFDDFDISNFKPEYGVVMLCYPSNPTGYSPNSEDLKTFIEYCRDKDITVILDMPYYHLFNSFEDEIYNLYYDNVIILSSFSKSLGLSGFRIGYVATKNKELYDTMHIRSLYKYNSISNVPQQIINLLLSTGAGEQSIDKYKYRTRKDIHSNIQFLLENRLLFDEYPAEYGGIPVGPFAIINIPFQELLDNKISSVPLSKFTLFKKGTEEYEKANKLSRISVAVKHDLFKKYFELL